MRLYRYVAVRGQRLRAVLVERDRRAEAEGGAGGARAHRRRRRRAALQLRSGPEGSKG